MRMRIHIIIIFALSTLLIQSTMRFVGYITRVTGSMQSQYASYKLLSTQGWLVHVLEAVLLLLLLLALCSSVLVSYNRIRFMRFKLTAQLKKKDV